MSDTQYRIFNKSPGFSRTYISLYWADAMGCGYAWSSSVKEARLFNSLEDAARAAAAIEKQAAIHNAARIQPGPACVLSIVPVTGGNAVGLRRVAAAR